MYFKNVRLWLMWATAVLFFAYQFIMRVAPGLVMPELMQKFQVDATSFGLFASMYYFAYAGMQIPVALLLDRYGPRNVISACALLAAVGTILMVQTEHWGLALLSRFLIGAGSAGGFLGASKVISLWFPERMYTKMVGITFTFGLMGALYGGKPVGSLITLLGWEKVLTGVGIVGVGIGLLVFLFIQKHERENEDRNGSTVTNLKAILKDKTLIFMAIANLLMVGSLEGFADVWGVSYLMLTRGISKGDAAMLTSTIFFGMLFGGPLLAYVSDKLKNEGAVISACGFFMAAIFLLLLMFDQLNVSVLYGLLFLTGILCCYQVLVFSMGAKRVTPELSGITVAFLNCINMLGGSFFHTMIGSLLDVFWTGNVENQVRVYEVVTYHYALSVIPVTAIVGAFIFYMIKGRSEKRRTEKSLELVDNSLSI